MKPLMYFLIPLMLFIQPIKKGVFKFNQEVHDFGKIPKGKPVSFMFEFENVGEQPIILFTVKPVCGCTIADFTKIPVKKNHRGFVKITFNATTSQEFNKAVVITSNADTPTKDLTIKGEVY